MLHDFQARRRRFFGTPLPAPSPGEVRRLRIQTGLSQGWWAQRLKVTPKTFQRWDRDDVEMPSATWETYVVAVQRGLARIDAENFNAAEAEGEGEE